MIDRDYYCSKKFSEIWLNLNTKQIASCCAGQPQKIDFQDVEKNGLLNISYIRNDRQQMLDNQRVNTCEHACWKTEDNHLPSLRTIHPPDNTIYKSSSIDHLQRINISLGDRCTLTCVYCSKNSSRAWTEEIKKNGNYNLDSDSYKITKKDLIIKNLKQDHLYNSTKFEQIYEQLVKNKDSISTWYIVGGEPLLYEKQLIDLLDIIPPTAEIIILSGLGLPKNKFVRLLDTLKTYPNFKLGLSAENIDHLYEFNRYGNSFEHFLDLLDYVKKSKVKYQFYSTLSNITAFGYADFVNFIDNNIEIEENLCFDPDFLQVQIMDADSKNQLLESLDKQNNKQFKFLIESLQVEYTVSPIEQQNLATFLKEFSTRRNLELNIFPKTFLKWLNLHVV